MIRRAVFICCVLLVGPAALAVQPGTWEHKTEADFAGGQFNKTVVTSLGEVLLARATETLAPASEELGMISAMAVDRRGRLYVAAAPAATVYRLEKKKLVRIAELPGVLVRVMRFVDGQLLAGTSGDKAGVYRINDDGEVKPVWAEKQVTLVWEILPGPKDSLYVATGPQGKLYQLTNLKKEPTAKVIYESDDENILSLAAARDGRLYAGTGENGLIIEIDPVAKASRIIYDAPETEIACIVVAEDGVVYAATSDSSKAGPDGEAPSDREKGAPAPAPATQPTAAPAGVESPPDGESGTYIQPDPAQRGPDAVEFLAGQPTPAVEPAAARMVESSLSTAPAAPIPANGPPVIVIRGGPPRRGSARPPGPPPPAEEETEGNAVYGIDKAGFVRAVFRRPVAILDMVLHKDTLVLATGHGGQVFSVDLAKDRTSMLVKLDPKDVTVLTPDGKGKLYIGTANKAAVFAIADQLAKEGTFLSSALDARQIAAWGTLKVRAEIPRGCTATIATRSGNVAKPDEKTWSDFSDETALGDGWAPMASPAGRFLQYRLTLAGKGKATPTVDQVQLVYQVNNLAPVIRAVQVVPSVAPDSERGQGGPGARKTHRMIKIQAADPNNDKLHYAVFFRKAGAKRWIQLVEKFAEDVYPWDTTTVADGAYEVRVEACDTPSNPRDSALTAGRISRPVVVDNAPPRLTELAAKAEKDGKVTLSGKIADQMSRIVKIEYALDGIKEWLDVLPADGICDSQAESFSTAVADLEAGTHHLAVKATDEYGNTGYASLEVTVQK